MRPILNVGLDRTTLLCQCNTAILTGEGMANSPTCACASVAFIALSSLLLEVEEDKAYRW